LKELNKGNYTIRFCDPNISEAIDLQLRINAPQFLKHHAKFLMKVLIYNLLVIFIFFYNYLVRFSQLLQPLFLNAFAPCINQCLTLNRLCDYLPLFRGNHVEISIVYVVHQLSHAYQSPFYYVKNRSDFYLQSFVSVAIH
jgi:hypothetical protein